ncbi:MAG: P1 family peptidase [Vulcanimicrobiaceae bacterium]
MKRKTFVASAATAAVAASLREGDAVELSAIKPSSGITDVDGIKVGHWTSTARPTGCTVVLAPPEGAVGGVDVRGSAPGTRETDLLNPENLVERVNAIVLSGGSAFGIDAASGVMRYLEEHNVGFVVSPIVKVPIVPAAILYDLGVGDWKIRPDAAAGHAACQAATTQRPAEGNAGAGAGATVGKFFGLPRAMKSGIGTASLETHGLIVGAIVAVNAIGEVVDPSNGHTIAGVRNAPEGKKIVDLMAEILSGNLPPALAPGTATTIGVVATNAAITKVQAQKIAQMAQDGIARAIRPAHTMFDGDTIFVMATGSAKKSGNPTLLGAMAAEAVAASIVRAIHAATSLPNLPAARDLR